MIDVLFVFVLDSSHVKWNEIWCVVQVKTVSSPFIEWPVFIAPPVTGPKSGYRWAAGGLKPKPRLGQKKS